MLLFRIGSPDRSASDMLENVIFVVGQTSLLKSNVCFSFNTKRDTNSIVRVQIIVIHCKFVVLRPDYKTKQTHEGCSDSSTVGFLHIGINKLNWLWLLKIIIKFFMLPFWCILPSLIRLKKDCIGTTLRTSLVHIKAVLLPIEMFQPCSKPYQNAQPPLY